MTYKVTYNVSNRATWVERYEMPEEGGAGPAITAIEFNVGDGLIKKTLGSGITYDQATATAVVTIDDSEMRQLCKGRYPVGMVITISGEPVQIIGDDSSVTVYDGHTT